MPKNKEQLILTKDDHAMIISYIKHALDRSMFTSVEAEALQAELRRAKLVENKAVPDDVVRLNSTVTVREEKADKVMELTLVTPEKADIKRRRISVLSPLAAALIGFRKGMKVAWKMPAGLKTFRILEVNNMI